MIFSVSKDPITSTEKTAHMYDWELWQGFDALLHAVERKVWSNMVWMPKVRRSQNFHFCQALVLDFDGERPLQWAFDKFRHCVHIIYTSKSHQKEKSGVVADRFRVIIPTSEPIFQEHAVFNLQSWTEKAECEENACYDLGRRWMPGKIVKVQREGRLMHPKEAPPEVVARVQAPAASGGGASGKIPLDVLRILQDKTPVGLGLRHRKMVRAAITLAERGMLEEEFIRLVRPLNLWQDDSESTISGIWRKYGL